MTMTPDDVAAIRARAVAARYELDVRRGEVLALCDALEAAWAAREWLEDRGNGWRERAERAEADATSWRVRAEKNDQLAQLQQARAERAEGLYDELERECAATANTANDPAPSGRDTFATTVTESEAPKRMSAQRIAETQHLADAVRAEEDRLAAEGDDAEETLENYRAMYHEAYDRAWERYKIIEDQEKELRTLRASEALYAAKVIELRYLEHANTVWRERAERAEAQANAAAEDAITLERALARVRALCDDHPRGLYPYEIRAAIEGDHP